MEISNQEITDLLTNLKVRFNQHSNHFSNLNWQTIENRLIENKVKLWALLQMEITGGEPSLLRFDEQNSELYFTDFSVESPIGRRSFCYDQEALEKRKANKPLNSALNLAKTMGVELLSEQDYFELQTFAQFDTKSSSWLLTPDEIRKKGGAIFGDCRFGRTFIYHNGAESYYAARGFRAILKI